MDTEIPEPEPRPAPAPPGLERQHPLLVETVFHSIASNIPYLQLIQLRMVCKTWAGLVKAILHSRKNLVFRGNFDMCSCDKMKSITSEFKKDDMGIAQVRFEKVYFTECLEGLECLRHRQMIHLSGLYLHNCAISEETFKYILRQYCQTLEELTFIINTISLVHGRMGEFVIPEILIHPLPIPLYPDPPRWGTSDIEAFVGRTSMFLKFPHIKKLHLTSHTVEYDVHEIAATFPAVVDLVLVGIPVRLVSINSLPQRPTFPKLRRLKMESAMAHWQTQFEDQIVHLVDMDMNLRHLELSKVALTNFMIHHIHSLLLSQSNTLESFKLTLRSCWATMTEDEDDRNCPDIPSNTPKLPKLTEIDLPMEVINNFAETLERIPNIRSLSLICNTVSSFDTLENIPSDMDPYLQVNELNLGHISLGDLRQMSRLFPNLTRLNIYYCTNRLLQIVFANFKKLQVLEVGSAEEEDDLTDSGILGISLELRRSGQIDQESCKTDGSSPSICDLKELQKLLLMPRHNMAITDKSFLSGVLELPELCTLELSNIKVTDRFEKELAKCGFNLRAITTVLTANSDEVTFNIYKRDSGSPSSSSSFAPKGVVSQFEVSIS